MNLLVSFGLLDYCSFQLVMEKMYVPFSRVECFYCITYFQTFLKFSLVCHDLSAGDNAVSGVGFYSYVSNGMLCIVVKSSSKCLILLPNLLPTSCQSPTQLLTSAVFMQNANSSSGASM